MSGPELVPPKPAQAAASQEVSAKRGGQSLRAKYGHNWLFRLNYLPPWLHRGAVEPLLRGDTISGVARWIMRHPNRGGMSDCHSVETFLEMMALCSRLA
jgi:hypothetical protein